MGLAETAELAVKLTLDDSQFGRAMRSVDGRLEGIGRTAKRVGKGIAVGLGVTATGGALLLVDQLRRGIDELKELEQAQAQTNAVIESTGGVAGVTAEQVRLLAEKYEDVSAVVDDKVIQSAENMLLTFTNVREDAFEPALAAALDMSTALGIDVVTAAKDLGKALQDPEKGLGKLERKIGPLDQKTRDLIASLMEQGDVLGAQKVLLDEISERYGGSFAATADTAAGKQAKLADKVEEVQKALSEKMLPVIKKVADRLAEYLGKPETLAFFERLGDTIASLFTDENLNTAAAAMETAASAVGTAISLFNQLPPEIKALAIGAFTLNKVTGGAVGGAAEAFGKILGAGLQKIFAANVTVIGTNVTGAGGTAAAGGGAVSNIAKGAAAATAVVGVGTISQGVSQALRDNGMTANALGNDLVRGIMLPGFDTLTNIGEIPAQFDRLVNSVRGVETSVEAANGAEIQNERGEGAKHRAKLEQLRQKEQESLVAFRAGERATQRGNSIARSGNSILERIRQKKTSFRLNNNISIRTSVSVSEVQRQGRYTSRVARSTSLSAS